MAGLYDADKTPFLRVADVQDRIFMINPKKNPFTRLLKRGSKPSTMLLQWPLQKYPDRGYGGVLDGTDKTTFSKTDRENAAVYAMLMQSEGWMVSTIAEMTKTWGVADEVAKQKTDDAILFAQSIEKMFCSDVDTTVGSGQTPYKTRGIFSWMDTDAQAQLPVPANFRPLAACEYTGTNANFTLAAFKTMLRAAAVDAGNQIDLVGYVGLDVKTRMTEWQESLVATATDARRLSVTQGEKKLTSAVNFFEFDEGNVSVMPTWNMLCDATTGAQTAYTPKSGVFINRDMWELRYFKDVQSIELPNLGGGRRGFHEAALALVCYNPRGQLVVKSAS
jgi:hypothetical protein